MTILCYNQRYGVVAAVGFTTGWLWSNPRRSCAPAARRASALACRAAATTAADTCEQHTQTAATAPALTHAQPAHRRTDAPTPKMQHGRAHSTRSPNLRPSLGIGTLLRLPCKLRPVLLALGARAGSAAGSAARPTTARLVHNRDLQSSGRDKRRGAGQSHAQRRGVCTPWYHTATPRQHACTYNDAGLAPGVPAGLAAGRGVFGVPGAGDALPLGRRATLGLLLRPTPMPATPPPRPPPPALPPRPRADCGVPRGVWDLGDAADPPDWLDSRRCTRTPATHIRPTSAHTPNRRCLSRTPSISNAPA
jgi:hypothetical protein